MKNQMKIKQLLLFSVLTIFIWSCEKEEIVPDAVSSSNEVEIQEKGFVINGKFVGAGYGFDPKDTGRAYNIPFKLSRVGESNLPNVQAFKNRATYEFHENIKDVYEAKGKADQFNANVNYEPYFNFGFNYDPSKSSVFKENSNDGILVITLEQFVSKYDVLGNPGPEALTNTASDLSKDPDRFKDNYGDYYVKSAIYGGTLNLVIKFNTRDFNEFERKNIKAGFKLGILKIFNIGAGTDKQKTDALKLLKKSVSINYESNTTYQPSGGILENLKNGSTSAGGNLMNDFSKFLKAKPLNPVVMYHDVQNYSKYIKYSGYNDNPTTAKTCAKLYKEWDYMVKVANLVRSNFSKSSSVYKRAQRLRNIASSNSQKARDCNSGNIPPTYDSMIEFKDFVDWYELQQRAIGNRRYRLKGNSGRYLYLTNEEAIAAGNVLTNNWVDEGFAFYLMSSDIDYVDAIIPLHRYKMESHGGKPLYKYSRNNKLKWFTDRGGKYEGIAGYVSKTPFAGGVRLYELYKGDINKGTRSYLYTISKSERDNAVNKYGYKPTKLVVYAWPK